MEVLLQVGAPPAHRFPVLGEIGRRGRDRQADKQTERQTVFERQTGEEEKIRKGHSKGKDGKRMAKDFVRVGRKEERDMDK